MKIKYLTTKDLRTFIIWAMHEIDEYKDFIELCEKRIKLLKYEKEKQKTK